MKFRNFHHLQKYTSDSYFSHHQDSAGKYSFLALQYARSLVLRFPLPGLDLQPAHRSRLYILFLLIYLNRNPQHDKERHTLVRAPQVHSSSLLM